MVLHFFCLVKVWFFSPFVPLQDCREVNCIFTESRVICKTGRKNGKVFVSVLTEMKFGCFQQNNLLV